MSAFVDQLRVAPRNELEDLLWSVTWLFHLDGRVLESKNDEITELITQLSGRDRQDDEYNAEFIRIFHEIVGEVPE